jgi:hypothetical protein
MRLSEIIPRQTDRAVIIGHTGSGKTVLAKHLLQWKPYTVVYDSKGTIDWPEYELHTNLRSIGNTLYPRLIYRPDIDSQNENIVEKFFEWVYERRNTTLYVDEVYSIASRTYMPKYYQAILTRGRERNTVAWNSTQRPKEIPKFLLSESEHYYIFRLRLPQDRKEVEEVSGIDSQAIYDLPAHTFLYSNAAGDKLPAMKLSL